MQGDEKVGDEKVACKLKFVYLAEEGSWGQISDL